MQFPLKKHIINKKKIINYGVNTCYYVGCSNDLWISYYINFNLSGWWNNTLRNIIIIIFICSVFRHAKLCLFLAFKKCWRVWLIDANAPKQLQFAVLLQIISATFTMYHKHLPSICNASIIKDCYFAIRTCLIWSWFFFFRIL